MSDLRKDRFTYVVARYMVQLTFSYERENRMIEAYKGDRIGGL